MKKIILAVCFLLMAQSFVFADEIIDSKGNIIPCKIVTVVDGLIEYKKDGNMHSFQREKDSLIFNDYVDVRLKLTKRDDIKRISGKVIVKDSDVVIIKTENGNMSIPWYKVKFVGVYKPEEK